MKKEKTNKNRIPLLLVCGVISAPFFFILSIIQIFTRAGFDIRRHAISTLTLGDMGWIQSANFIITGLLAIAASIGIRYFLNGDKGGTWGPILIGVYGLGMILAGVCKPDPGLGFPSGAPEGAPTSMSIPAAIHSFAFFIAFLCLIAACFVLARRFSKERKQGWRIYCIATGILAPLLIILGMSLGTWIGVIMGLAGMIAFGWVSALSGHIQGKLSRV
ncbi:DUF998 domain-containing protein [Shimazuella kribbensis]|uniref:DUF998 domain-containing protein n=1 Tax=Shimazuella kribbensis TaxID=139808 RepID=UPI000567A650|nr:DUF998 domain-containing protein [Shimazuella kribbensis]